tara:strand:+ start:1072 stop:2316 length:1245 start_codon:yes stop_codon:yes gene_type:complete
MNTLLKAYKPTPLAIASFLHIINEIIGDSLSEKTRNKIPIAVSVWECSRCTYSHEEDLVSRTTCAMCETPRSITNTISIDSTYSTGDSITVVSETSPSADDDEDEVANVEEKIYDGKTWVVDYDDQSIYFWDEDDERHGEIIGTWGDDGPELQDEYMWMLDSVSYGNVGFACRPKKLASSVENVEQIVNNCLSPIISLIIGDSLREKTSEECPETTDQDGFYTSSREPQPEPKTAPLARKIRHFNTMHSHKKNGRFGIHSYKHSIEYKTAVLSVGYTSGIKEKERNNTFNSMLDFFNRSEAGDKVYINGRPTKSGKNLVTHCGIYTGKVFTPDLTHPAIRRLTALGCIFNEGVIGTGLCIDHDLTSAPIYIELYDFEKIPAESQIMGPGIVGRMVYEVRPELPSCKKFLNTFAS